MTRTPESSPERGSIGGVRLLEKSLPYRLDAFPPCYSPGSSPDRGSGGVSLPPAGGLPLKPLDVSTDNAPRSSPGRGLRDSAEDDGPPVFAPEHDFDTAEASIARISPTQNFFPDNSSSVSNPERRAARSAVSGDGVGDDALQYDLDAAESSTARLPPAKLSPHFFPDNSRSLSSPQRSPERSAISGNGAVPSLRPSLQENQPPLAVQKHPDSNPPAYQARPLARRQRRRNRFQRIIPSRSRRRSLYRQLKVCLCYRS